MRCEGRSQCAGRATPRGSGVKASPKNKGTRDIAYLQFFTVSGGERQGATLWFEMSELKEVLEGPSAALKALSGAKLWL